MDAIRLLLYTITAICCGALAYRLYPVKNALARMYAVLLTAIVVNVIVLGAIRVFVMVGGNPLHATVQAMLAVNAALLSAVSIALLITFYYETRNGSSS